MKMNKFGKIALAAAITLGGFGAIQSGKASAASISSQGISINPVSDTLNLAWHPEGAQVAVKNGNTYPVQVTLILKDSTSLVLSNTQSATLQPGEKKYFTYSGFVWKEDGTQYHYEINSLGLVSTPFTVTGTLSAPKPTTTTTNTYTTTSSSGSHYDIYGNYIQDGSYQPAPPTYIENTSDTMCYLHCE